MRDLDEACAVANRIAPEHLELAVADPDALLPQIRHAGAIFLGHHASEALGDYCAGPNHVLPTGRTARFSSPLGVYDFQKRSSVLDISAAAAHALGPVAATLAHGEGLPAHAQSARYRVARGLTDAPARFRACVAAVVRPEIRALTAYPVAHADGHDQARRDGESVPAAAGGARRRSPPRSPTCRVNRYPDGGGDARQGGAARGVRACPRALGLVLGNGSDELIQMLTAAVARPARRSSRRSRRSCMYRMNAALADLRFVGVPLRADFSLDIDAMLAAIARERPALVWLAYPNNPTGTLFDAGATSSAILARGARAGRRRRGVLRVRGRDLPAARCSSSPNLVVVRTLSKIGHGGRCASATRSRAPGVDRRARQGAPAVQRQRADAGGRRRCCCAHGALLAEQAAAIRRERARMDAALAALRRVDRVPDARQFRAGARSRRRRTGSARCGDAGILVKNVARLASAARRIACASPSARPTENDAVLAALSRNA